MKAIIKFSVTVICAISLFGCSSSQPVETPREANISQMDSTLTPEQKNLLNDMKSNVQDEDLLTKACELAEQGDVNGAMKTLGQIDKQSTQLKLSMFGLNHQEIISNFRNRKHDNGLDCSQYIVVTEHPELR